MEAHHLVVQGRVQGVNFRSATRQTARRHGVAGWVRNRDDGAVEAWIEAGGPPAGSVDHVEVEQVTPEGLDGFQVRR